VEIPILLKLHHLIDRSPRRILWLFEELDIEYEVQSYRRDPHSRQEPGEVRAISPMGKLPVLMDRGHAVVEHGAIVDYVIRHHGNGRLQPGYFGSAYDEYMQWVHFAEGSFLWPLVIDDSVASFGEACAPLRTYIDQEIARNLSFVDMKLADRAYLLGRELTGADIQVSHIGEATGGKVGWSRYPNLESWVKRFQSRPAYQRAVGRGEA
jgi:glutathione S-transferase